MLKSVLPLRIFNNYFCKQYSLQNYSPRSEQEAWIAIMYAAMEADGYVSEIEIQKLFQVLDNQDLLKKKHIADYYQPAMLAYRVIGSKQLIDRSVPLVQPQNKPILFAFIMQLLLADGILGKTEKEIARYLSMVLNLEMHDVKQIISDMLGKR